MLRATLILAVVSASASLTGQVIRTETATVGTIAKFYPGTSELAVIAKKRQNTKFLTIQVVDNAHRAVGLTDLTPTDISIILKNLEKMAEEASKSSDDLSYDRPENKFSAGIRGGSEPSVSFLVRGVLVAVLGRSESENREILLDFIGLLRKGKAILEFQPK